MLKIVDDVAEFAEASEGFFHGLFCAQPGSTVPRSKLEDQARQERMAQVQAKIRDAWQRTVVVDVWVAITLVVVEAYDSTIQFNWQDWVHFFVAGALVMLVRAIILGSNVLRMFAIPQSNDVAMSIEKERGRQRVHTDPEPD